MQNRISIGIDLLYDSELLLEVPLDLTSQRFFRSLGGTFEGPKIRGKFLPGGSDLMTMLPDGTGALDYRHCLETDNGALIMTVGAGRIYLPDDVGAELSGGTVLADIDPTRYYFRFSADFRTGDDRYSWLNRVTAVGGGRAVANGIALTAYQVT